MGNLKSLTPNPRPLTPNPFMLQRVIRIAASLAIVVIAYWLYALLVVRWIEPSVDPNRAQGITAEQRSAGMKLVEKQIDQFRGLFPPGAWELNHPKILESETNNAKLLLDDYKNQGNGQVWIPRCDIIFSPPADDEAQRRRQAVVLEVPHGAVLRFDRPLDLSQAKFGRLVGGQLKGPVTIRSDGKQPGPEDDLLVTTAGDLELTEQTISTPSPVEFQWGPHRGRGQDMVIKLLSGQPQPGKEQSGPNIAGMESFEMRHVDRLHLELPQSASPPAGKPQSVPVEITCRGPFRFDMVRHVATFQDRVEVMKTNPYGPSDQLSCESLTLYFIPRPKSPAAQAAVKPDPAGAFDLAVGRVEARGNPAVLTAPSEKVVARGERIEYSLQANSLAMDGVQEVFLQQGANEIHARSLYYESSAAGPGHFGRVVAQGPGYLHGRADEHPDQQLEAVWKDKLRVYPDERNQVISLTGGAELNFPRMGQLQAREIFLWLLEGPPGGKTQAPPRPDRMWARHDVHVNSPQLFGTVEDLQVWFDDPGASQGPAAAGNPMLGGLASAGLPVARPIGLTMPSPAGPMAPAGAAAPTPPQTAAASQPPALQRFKVVGRLFQARVALGGPQITVSRLKIEDNVQFLQTQTARPGDRPIMICGDSLEATSVNSPQGLVTVTGQPARFDGGPLAMTGLNINLDQAANRVWIDGPGQMQVPLPPSAQGQPPGMLTIDWQRKMWFDGLNVHFEHAVVGRMGPQEMRTETMIAQLVRPIRFSDPVAPEGIPVEIINCLGGADGVRLENRTPTSHDQLQTSDLGLNVHTGELNGGAGWINSVRRGSDDAMGGPMAGLAGPPPGPGRAAKDTLNCLHVKFEKSMHGNVGNPWARRLTFDNLVRAVYAPVDNWDALLTADALDQLGPQAVTLRCDRLSVAEMAIPFRGPPWFEMEANGSTVVESATFTALGERITYDGRKDLLILSGEGRDAELYHQTQVGGERDHTAMKTIYYYPRTNKMGSASGAEMLQFTLPPAGNRKLGP